MRRMGYAVAGLVAAAVLLAGVAQAQVAAPSLNPVLVESTLATPNRLTEPYNPASLPWSGSSRIGVVGTDLKAEDVIGGVTSPSGDGRGNVLQLRLVGAMFALAAERYAMSLNNVGGGGGADINGTLVSGAMRLGDVLSIGIAQQQAKFIQPGGEQSETLPVGGVTVRLGAALYLGASGGKETLKLSSGGFSVEDSRSVVRYGVAWHWRDNGNGMHLELYHESVAAIDNPIFTDDERQTNAARAEFLFSDILLGLSKRSAEATAPGGTLTRKVDLQTVTVGWAPMMGLSVVATVMREESVNQPSGPETDIDTKLLGVAWSF